LLDAVCKVYPHDTLIALHIHHGLQKQADQWFVFCERLAKYYKIGFDFRLLHLQDQTGNVEARARSARYEASLIYAKRMIWIISYSHTIKMTKQRPCCCNYCEVPALLDYLPWGPRRNSAVLPASVLPCGDHYSSKLAKSLKRMPGDGACNG
jgi:hypothetical protein